MAGGEEFNRFQRMACETPIARLYGVSHMLTKVNLTTFEHRKRVGSNCLDQLDLNVGVPLGVARQKI
ncbi:hypothetical protein GJW-30_1_02699 [Variibacter gotjawalensis]|uniref:Uncharacterized protein n=1 Tax=Variibacter gotjawalensis TaxID=1333996 RepID=A0A0S3PW90_9BRAD|nr:hypothetical protein GJW-30_1_02699 [Variibacter gotjawalensis]